MSGFEKIDFDVKNGVAPSGEVEDMAKRKKSKTFFKRNRKNILIGVGVFLILFVIGFVIPVLAVVKSAKTTYAQTKVLSAALKQQNITAAADELKKTQVALADTTKKMKFLGYLHFVPVANFYYNDATHLLNAATEGLKTGDTVIESLTPYADVLGLKGQGSFSGGSAEDRIKTAVLTMGKITPKIDDIAASLDVIQKEVDGVNPNHYPTFIFGKKIKAQLTQLKTITDQGSEFVDQARPLIKQLPLLLGENEDKRYLVLFQNDKEIRPTGGFITAFAIFKLTNGVITLERSEDIYTLDDSISGKSRAPAPILKYLPGVSVLNLRDSNISPDFIESMKTFNALYNRAGQKVNVDGIIAIDTYVLTNTIKVLDDQIAVDGQTYTTKNDPRCDCPQVIYSLEDNISRPVNYVKTDRKGLLGDMLKALMSKALSSSPKIYWGPLFQTLIAQTNEKHILFALEDEQAQKGIEALDAAGQIKNFDGDYFHLNEANFSGAKVNLFLDQTVEQAYSVKSGVITKTVTVNYKNLHAPSDCNLERGGLCLNAEYRDWFRVYVPKGSKLVSSDGSQVKVTSYDELGKTVFDGFLTVRPLGKATLTLTYTLPFKVDGSSLPLFVQKQPGTDAPEYSIKVNGRTIEKFPLLTNKEFEVKL